MDLQVNKIKRKLQKKKQHVDADIFDIHNVFEYGFPVAPTAVAFDDTLSLLALASGSGEVRVYGQAGVLMVAGHKKNVKVSQLVWIPNEGRLVSLAESSGQSLFSLFEINEVEGTAVLQLVKEKQLEAKKATTCTILDGKTLLVGTEKGDVLSLDLESFEFSDDTIHLDVAMQNVPDDFKVNPGSVKVISFHPTESNLVLIGYNKGLLILWNLEFKLAQGTFFTSCQCLESLSWYSDGSKFVTAHADGSYYTWSKDVEKQFNGPSQVFPFGESEPGQQMSKIAVHQTQNGEDMLIFAGGLPKNTYASTNSVSIRQGDHEVNYELASKVIDFVVVSETVIKETSEENQAEEQEGAEDSETPKVQYAYPSALLVLTEGELIAVDLKTVSEDDAKHPLWPAIKKPYLNSASPNDITCLYFFEDCGAEFVEQLTKFGSEQFADFSSQAWPVTGGSVKEDEKFNVAVTGHYDGTVRFYDVNTGKFNLLYTLNLNNYFRPEDDLDEEPVEHESLGDVKLRKIGEDFATCGDDNRFAVCKLYICPKSRSLFVGSHSGQVVVFEFGGENPEEIKICEVKIVPDEANFKWKGCHPAKAKDLSEVTLPTGYTVSYVVQCEPPAPVTAMIASNKYGLISVGTSHGFGVFDCVSKKTLLTRSTLVENDESASGAKLSKTKSLREGIRNSFRRLKPKKAESTTDASVKAESKPSAGASAEPLPKVAETKTEEAEHKADDAEKPAEDKEPEKPAEDEAAAGDAEGEKKDEDKPAEESAEAAEEPAKTEEAEEPAKTEEVEEVAKTDEEKLKEMEESADNAAGSSTQQPSSSGPTVTIVEPEEAKSGHVGRVVEARGESQDKTMMSTVRCLAFADTFLRNNKDYSPSLWVGTHAGSVYSYLINMPDDRESGEVSLRLAKEIRLLHRAPVVYINVLDHSGFPLPDSAAVSAEKVSAADMSGHHHLLVCSEEQMKMFTLPALKSKYKEKLTAVHGVKVRKVAPIKIRRDDQSLNFLGCMLNDGNVCVFSLPALYRQFTDKLVEADNKIATLYTEFTNDGSAYVLEQTNLVKHYALAKNIHSKPICVTLPEGCRSVAVPEPEPEPVEEAAAEEVEETVEAENAENVESAPPPMTENTEDAKAEEEDGQGEDLPTVEEEAKKMIDDAEVSKDAEFQKRIQEELSSDNPEITSTTVTTYRAIESRTTITSDDGVECHKIITTTRNTTLSLDGDVITQKTQQKEEFEISPSEEQEPPEVGQADEAEPTEEGTQEEEAPSEEGVVVQTTTSFVESVPEATLSEEPAVEVTQDEENTAEQTPAEEAAEPENKSGYVTSDDEILHADAVQVESEPTPVRTATITQNEDDQITHHIESEETEAPVAEEESAAPIEETPAPEEASEEAAAPAEEKTEEASEETTEPVTEEPEPAAEDVETALPVEETTEAETEKPDDDEAPKEENADDGISGECYGGSQGKLYSPMGRENEDVSAPVDNEANEEAEPKETEKEEVDDAGDVPEEQNGHEEPQENGENHQDDDAVPNGDVAASEEGNEGSAAENEPEGDDIEAKKAALAAEESPATEATPEEALTADE